MNLSLLKLACQLIHQAIHSDAKYVSIAGRRFPIKHLPNGCRSIQYETILFTEQDKRKKSLYARYAKQGKEITWGIRNGEWILIDDFGVQIPEQLKLNLNKLQLV